MSKCQAPWKILHFSPSYEHLTTLYTSHLVSPAVGHQVPEGTPGQRLHWYPSLQEIHKRFWFSLTEPRLDMRQHSSQGKGKDKHKGKKSMTKETERATKTCKNPAPPPISTSPTWVSADHEAGSPEFSESASQPVLPTIVHPTSHSLIKM